ncbi:5-dehydro-2-deoxygluconokinase [Ahrensia sp. R2A130]|nr:5-dehydro-2-deoxygluconokinase [Ahrensia sp. R2A130]
MTTLDLITIGRSSVDLYGEQIGGRLEDMGSFAKYIGGSPTNIAAGTARLGLRSAVITRVGDEHMGRYIREQLSREGVDTNGVITDPERLTALVLLGIRDEDQFPLIFYRENCADMAICEDDIDPAFIASARCVTATGTHLSNPKTEAAVLKALRLARKNGARTALDIDYRPNLWGLAGHGDGESRFIESEQVTAKLQSTLRLFDLIVGTEEEFHIAGGTTDTITALKAVRAVSGATLVCKRGPMGAVAFTDTIAEDLDAGISGPGFPIEVFNVLGAGDGFMSGLLRGWLCGEDWETALTWANACGAFAVSRHGCAPAYPSWEELQYFLQHGSPEQALRKDAKLEHIHWATNRPALDLPLHVSTLTDGDTLDTITGNGFVAPHDSDRERFFRAVDSGLWIGRSVTPGFSDFAQWPVVHTAVIHWNGDGAALATSILAARAKGVETLLHIPADAELSALIEQHCWPDIWALNSAAQIDALIAQNPWTRGVLLPQDTNQERCIGTHDFTPL